MNRIAINRRLGEIAEEADAKAAAHKAGRLATKDYRKFVEDAHAEAEELRSTLKAVEQAALRYAGATEVAPTGYPQVPAGVDMGAIVPATPMDLTHGQIQGLLAAAEVRTPWSTEVKPKSFREAVMTKSAVSEGGIGGGFTGNLPPVQSLYAVGLGYESTRIADLIPGAQMPGPSATWLSHTANSAEVGAVAELGTKGDIGPTITEHQVTPTKIAGIVSLSLESWQDTLQYGEGSFSAWLPQELTRSLINEESNLLLNAVSGTGNATFNGLLNTSGTLTRAVGSDAPLDALAKAYVDVRTGTAFPDPDLVITHPATLGALRREKDSEGRYILDLLAGPLNLTADGSPRVSGPASEPNAFSVVPQGSPAISGNLWGAPIATTTHCPAGTALVMSVKAGTGIFWQRLGIRIEFNMWGDTEWTTNTYSFRAEERIALSVPRPSALNVVTGLPVS
jgi:HK97 family phage major capsid protein